MKQINPVTVFKTERVEVIRLGFSDYELYFDNEFVKGFRNSDEAEHAAAMRLEEEMRDYLAGAQTWRAA